MGVIFDNQGWQVPYKCILEGHGTGLPLRYMTVNTLNQTKNFNHS